MFTASYNAPVHFEPDNTSKPKVLIAGGGIGGLTLGILLKKAGVPFKIFERSHDVKQLGKHTHSRRPTFILHFVCCEQIKGLISSFLSI